jgi:NADH-quinone oxidoreductase subunit N
LAFSSVAHAGYMLLAVLALNPQSGGSLLIYVLAYSLSSLSAFAVLLAISKLKGTTTVQSFKGLAKQNPFLAIVTILAMLSLAGIPPTAGFLAKYYIFTAAIANNYLGLTLVAILGSVISVFYYFRIIIVMFEGEEGEVVSLGFNSKILLTISSALILLIGIFPDFLIKLLN